MKHQLLTRIKMNLGHHLGRTNCTASLWMTWVFMITLICRPIWVSSLAFDSIASLKSLVNNEEYLVEAVQEYLTREEERLERIRQQIYKIESRAARKRTLDAVQWAEYVTNLVEHPLNALNVIKDWSVLSSLTAEETDHFSAVTSSADELGVSLPDEEDYEGAMTAILRLQKTYNLPTEDVASGKIYNVTTRYRMDSTDRLTMGRLYMDVEHGAAISWFEMYLNQAELISEGTKKAFKNMMHIYEKAGDYARALHMAENLLHIDPENEQVQDEMDEYRRYISDQQNSGALNEQKFYWKSDRDIRLEYYETLCRGENIANNILVNKDLMCVYRRGVLPYVQYKEEIHSISPRISLFLDVITDRQADMLKEKAFPGLYRATVAHNAEFIASHERVSKLAWLFDTDGEVAALSQKISDITGLSTQYRELLSDAEAFQIVNYGIGGQYEPHFDFYEEEENALLMLPELLIGTRDRISTFMYYLSEVKAGGATVFPNIGVRIPPVKNAAAYWYNFDLAGEAGDRQTLHAGCPVLLGQKWVGNKWIRQNGQIFRRRCALNKHEIDPIFYSHQTRDRPNLLLSTNTR